MTVLEIPTTNGSGGPNLPPLEFFDYGGNEGDREPEQNYRAQSLLQRMAGLAVYVFSMRADTPDLMSEHFGRAEKRNALTPHIADPRG